MGLAEGPGAQFKFDGVKKLMSRPRDKPGDSGMETLTSLVREEPTSLVLICLPGHVVESHFLF